MSNFYLVCPVCKWRDINSEFKGYTLEPLRDPEKNISFGTMNFSARCTHCNWIGTIEFDIAINTERRGK